MAEPSTSPPRLGFGYQPEMNAPLDTVSPVDMAEERRAREAQTTTTDYIGSMWRQDSLVDGAMAEWAANSTLLPDENYNAFSDPGLAEASRDVWPEYQKELYRAHSPAHRDFIVERLRQKQTDLVRLGDMGLAGNVGRLALGVVSPDQLLMAYATMGASYTIRATQVARAVRQATSPVGAAVAGAGVRATQAANGTGLRAVAGGIGFSVAENVVYEKLRQSVNFEDDTAAVIEAGLFGAAFAAPFAVAGARAGSRVADIANKEHDILRVLKAVDDGADLTPEQGRLLQEASKAHDALVKFENGGLDQAGMEKALDDFHGPQEPDARWIDRMQGQLREQGRVMLDEMFPQRYGPEAPPRAPEAAPPRDPNTIDGPMSVAPDAPVKTALELAMEKAKVRKTKRTKADEAARKQKDLEEGYTGLEAENEQLRNKLLGDAWAKADADRAASKSRELAAMVRERELARMLVDEDAIPAKAPEAPATPPQGAGEGLPTGNAPEAPVEAPAAPAVEAAVDAPALQTAESFVGKEVSWTNRQGDLVFGDVEGINEYGRLTVRDTDGKTHSVAHTQLDEYRAETPTGFLPGSIGSAQRGVIESTASQRSYLTTVNIAGKEIPIRFDRYAVLNASPVKRIRELAFLLIKDPLQNDKFDAQGLTASERRKEVSRRLAGKFHLEANLALDEALTAMGIPIWNMPARLKFTKDFYAWTVRDLRGDPDVAKEAGQAHKAVQKAATAQREFYQTILKEAQDAGVKGAEGIEVNDFYANRIWNHARMREMADMHGPEAPVDVIAAAIKDKAAIIERFKKSPAFKAKPDMTDAQIIRNKAARFYKAVRSLEFSPALQEAVLAGRDMGTLRQSLKDMEVPDDQIDDLVDLMFEAKQGTEGDAGRAGNLKYRFALDESAKVSTEAGELRLSDLFEPDARVLVDTYAGSMAGHIGLARQGIKSTSDWRALIKEVNDEALADPSIDGDRVAKDMALLEDIHRNITGRPMATADFSITARSAAAFRGYTRAVVLPQLGIAAASELNRAVAQLGLRAMLHHMPSLRGFFRALRKGYIPDVGLARDIQLMTGFGNEMASSYARATELENGWTGRGLTRFEQVANNASHVVDTVSGNASFTSFLKQWSAMGAVQNMSDFARGRRALDAKLQERWVGQGLSVDDQDAVMAALKKYSAEDNNVLQAISYEDWQKADPRTYDLFQGFLNRQVRDIIQDHDMGETMPFMDSTLGKMFSELKTFMLVAHAKNFLKNLHYRDTTSMHIWAIGFLGESLAYSVQSAINAPGDLDERLAPDRIATAALFRMAALGSGTLLVESGYGLMTGGDSLVMPGSTANTDSRSFLNTPSLTVAKKLLNVPMTLTGATLGTDTTTRGEFRDAWNSIPGLRLYGLRAMGDYFADSFPASDPDKARTGP